VAIAVWLDAITIMTLLFHIADRLLPSPQPQPPITSYAYDGVHELDVRQNLLLLSPHPNSETAAS
jgi:hypothetical protein